MTVPSKEAAYNLKVVLYETGIKPDTLRAWERRYGLPQPDRTSGGHRLYSQYDIEMVKWLLARQNEGMRINRAVELWRSIVDSGEDPLVAIPYHLFGELTPAMGIVAGAKLDEMRQNWVSACMSFDEAASERVLAQAFAQYPLESVCIGVLQKGLSEIGDLWYEGKATVQQEHFASALAIRRLNSLIAGLPVPTRQERILLACPPNEEHIVAPLMISLLLRRQGLDVVYLGADVPLLYLESVVKTTGARLIIFAATRLPSAATLLEMALFLQDQRIMVGYGGWIFNRETELRRRIPGHFLGETLDNVAGVVENLLSFHPKHPVIEPVPEEYHLAEASFVENHVNIDASVWGKINGDGLNQHYLRIANEHLGHNIMAALKVGHLDALETELNWIETLIANNNIPTYVLHDYLRTYIQALQTHLDERGRIIIDWFVQRYS